MIIHWAKINIFESLHHSKIKEKINFVLLLNTLAFDVSLHKMYAMKHLCV